VVVSTIPADGATGVATNTTISVTFDRAMDALTITGSSDTSCTGTVQVSTGTFVNGTCVPIFSATATNSNQTFTFTPSPALANNTTYKIRVTTGAQSSAAV